MNKRTKKAKRKDSDSDLPPEDNRLSQLEVASLLGSKDSKKDIKNNVDGCFIEDQFLNSNTRRMNKLYICVTAADDGLFCGHKFLKFCNLNDHMRVHSGNKPFDCKVCKEECLRVCKENRGRGDCAHCFKQKGQLRKHESTHQLSRKQAQSSTTAI